MALPIDVFDILTSMDFSGVAVKMMCTLCVCVDEDWLYEAAGIVPITSSYPALRITSQSYDRLPGNFDIQYVALSELTTLTDIISNSNSNI